MKYIKKAESNKENLRSWRVEVYPNFIKNNPQYTVFYENFTIPDGEIKLVAYLDRKNPGKGLIELSNNKTIINIPSSSKTYNNCESVTIENFFLKSKNRNSIQSFFLQYLYAIEALFCEIVNLVKGRSKEIFLLFWSKSTALI